VVSGGEDAGDYDGVDEGSCNLGAGHLEDDGEGGGVAIFGGEAGVVVWNVQPDDED
jgi:hypothetical protein